MKTDLTKKHQVLKFLENNRNDEIAKYTKEYKGDRKIRELQVGHRPNLIQGKHKIVPAEKMIVNLQKKIVKTASNFLFGEAPVIVPNNPEEKNSAEVMRIIKKNRILSKLLDFAETVMSETMGVFIFSKGDEGEISMRGFKSDRGIFTPQFDSFGDLIAFYWEFKGDDDISYLWIFDKEYIYQYAGDGEYNYDTKWKHEFDVIPVVFHQQEEPEWFDVKEMIDRIEMILSKLAGSNNYFAFPILKMKGAVAKNAEGEDESLIDQSDDGKSLLLGFAEKNGQIVEADANFLQRDTGVDSIKLEIEYLKEMIFNISQTPDLSFNNVKGIGAISGTAIQLMLQDAINKAKSKQSDYQIVIERIINVIKSGIGAPREEMEFDIQFNLSLPKDTKEEIQNLVEAAGGSQILSQKSAVKLSPYTENIQEELDNLKEERGKRSSESLILNQDE